MSRDLVTDAHENWRAWLTTVTDHVATGATRQFGVLTAGSVGATAPMGLFNQVFAFTCPGPDDLVAAATWMTARGAPFWLTVPEPLLAEVEDLAAAAGLGAAAGHIPGMALASLDDLAGEDAAGTEIRQVVDPGGLDDVASVLADAFSVPHQAARGLVPPSMLDDPRLTWFVGYLDGAAVACGQLQHDGDVAGVYGIGVREAARRRGLGEAMSRRVLREGRDHGCAVGILQASDMGRPVYERMGFVEVVRYHLRVPLA